MKFSGDVVVGLEIHVELNSETKLFCSCPRKEKENELPNSRCCPTCLGMPGSKPVLNKAVIDFALKLCLAMKCKIAPELIFSRKSYFYPDLAKNYQVTQYELPLGSEGEVALSSGKKVGLTRIHLEEDPASLVHNGGVQQSASVLVDYNRSGNPLAEIVTKPEMNSADEARDFMKQLITILGYLEVFDVNNGIIKADANVSVKESGYSRVEVKNITGFKEIERALNYEIARQKRDVSEGKTIAVETRGWDADKGLTYSLRSKESEEDYGYIIDPDLIVTEITPDWIDRINAEMPELATEKLKKFLDDHGIEETTAQVLSKDKKLAEMYEAVSSKVDSSLASKWIRRELPRVLNYQKKTLEESGITSEHMISLLTLISGEKITEKIGQQLINKLGEGPYDVLDYVKKEGLSVVAGESELEILCGEAIQEAPQAIEEYKSGKEKALNYVVGIVMRKTKGQAKPDVVMKVLKKLID